MRKKMIGILAGMGPRSTAPFIDLVIDQCQEMYGAKDDEDFPPIMIYSLPTPFYHDRPIDDEKMISVLLRGLRKLEATGVHFIANPCNSTHLYFQQMKDAVKVPLLNIIEETINRIPRNSKKVTVLATAKTMAAGLFQKGVENAGKELVFDEEWQKHVDEIIAFVKLGESQSALTYKWEVLGKKIIEAGADTIILGCTDLNLAAVQLRDEQILDSTEVLAKAVVRMYLED